MPFSIHSHNQSKTLKKGDLVEIIKYQDSSKRIHTGRYAIVIEYANNLNNPLGIQVLIHDQSKNMKRFAFEWELHRVS